jgi:hypothetical protein
LFGPGVGRQSILSQALNNPKYQVVNLIDFRVYESFGLNRFVPVVMSFPAIQASFDALYPQGVCGDNHEGLAQVKNQ